MDASEVETVVDKDCSLDLNPNPTYPRGSDESMESDDSRKESNIEYDVFELAPAVSYRFGSGEIKTNSPWEQGISKQGSNCEGCQQIILDKRLRYDPHLCERCGGYLEDPAFHTIACTCSECKLTPHLKSAPVIASPSKPAY